MLRCVIFLAKRFRGADNTPSTNEKNQPGSVGFFGFDLAALDVAPGWLR
jgi:hypothetical protein